MCIAREAQSLNLVRNVASTIGVAINTLALVDSSASGG
jgi:hypothetical protein